MRHSSRAQEALGGRVAVLGIECANPLLVASGPLTDTVQQIGKLLAWGAGGVVTKTIFAGSEPAIREQFVRYGAGALNSTMYSHRPLAAWLDDVAEMRRRGWPVIVSIFADDPHGLGTLASRVVAAGAQALELGIACPNDGSQQRNAPQLVARYTECVRSVVEVPIAVKLAAHRDFVECARAACSAGADMISLSDALPAVAMDSERSVMRFGGPVGYSGPPIKPLVLNAIHELRTAGINVPLFGIGGVASASDVIEYLLAGAVAVQVLTTLMLNHPSTLATLVHGLASLPFASSFAK
ncbi:MAG TPA: tRNA-dihydrouridine synthase [Nitrospira sp.]